MGRGLREVTTILSHQNLQVLIRICKCSSQSPRCLAEILEQSLVAEPMLRIVIYADEVNAGDPLAAHSRRKLWMIYWSLLNFGPKHLSNEDLWFTLCSLPIGQCY